MTRQDHINRLKVIKGYCCAQKDQESLDYAIASLETDEAYQLEYERPQTLISLDVYKQVCAERDIAIEQLHELGYEFGEKINTKESK